MFYTIRLSIATYPSIRVQGGVAKNPYRRWTDRERAIIDGAVLGGTKAKELEASLPGRTRVQIQNSLGEARRRLRGDPPWGDLAKERADHDAVVAQGVCRICHEALVDEAGSLVHCSACVRAKRGEDVDVMVSTKNQADMLPWIFSSHPGQLASWLPSTKVVVDPFGGSGRLARACVRRGHSVVYNDIHPLLGRYVACLQERRHARVNLAVHEILARPGFRALYRKVRGDPDPDPIRAAAVVRIAAFNARSCRLDEVGAVSIVPMLVADHDTKLWDRMVVESRGFDEVIRDHDGLDTCFVLDPPYPGTSFYENNLNWAQFRDMLDLLARSRGRYLMVLPTGRRIVEMVLERNMKAWMRRIKTTRGSGRDLVVANYEITADVLEPVIPERYGVRRSSTKIAMVRRVEKALGDLGGEASRIDIAQLIGEDSPEILGALARARAEGIVEKSGRRRYRLRGHPDRVAPPPSRGAPKTSAPEPMEMGGRRRPIGIITTDLTLSAYASGNDAVFPKILDLYVHPGSVVADVTWGSGVFWKRVPKGRYVVNATDIKTGTDCRDLPYADSSHDALVLDPPYMEGLLRRDKGSPNGVDRFSSFRDRYSGGASASEGPKYHEAVLDLYFRAAREAHRVLRSGGVLIVKCQDEVSAQRQRLTHVEIVNEYERLGFRAEDLFVVVRQNRPSAKILRQRHARKNHSYFLVFVKQSRAE